MAAPVESKVKAASAATLVASFVVGWVVWKAPVFASLADPLQSAIASAVTSLGTLAAGWMAKHTPRLPSNDQTPRPYRAGR